MTTENVLREKVWVSGWGYKDGQITISGLTRKEIEAIEAAIHGQNWIKRNDAGRLEIIPALNPLPDPINDKEMAPFWRVRTDEEKNQQLKLFEFDPDGTKGHSPSIIIGSLCGYNYSPENYATQARRLESYGFKIMRSKRETDGKFWENWFLPGLWSAEGELKRRIEENKNWGDEKKLTIAIEFLRHNVQFGSLDVCVQHLAAVID